MKRTVERTGASLNFATIQELTSIQSTALSEQSTSQNTASGVTTIKISQLVPFRNNHPYKKRSKEKMEELATSIEKNGILTPIIVRPLESDTYEIIAGHCRSYVAEKIGLTEVPAIIKELSDDEATIVMVDTNIQREDIPPSERANALKMKFEVLKRQGKKIELSEELIEEGNEQTGGERSRDEVAKEFGMSGATVQRFIRLTELIPELLQMVDDKTLKFGIGVELSYLSMKQQNWVYEYMQANGAISLKQATAIKNANKQDELTEEKLLNILGKGTAKKKPSGKVVLSEKRLNSFFPASFSAQQREEVIIELLKEWAKSKDF